MKQERVETGQTMVPVLKMGELVLKDMRSESSAKKGKI